MGADGGITITNVKTGKSEYFDNYQAATLVEFIIRRDSVTGKFPVILAKFWLDYGFGSSFNMTASISAPTYGILEGDGFECHSEVNSKCSKKSDGENSDSDNFADCNCDMAEVEFDANVYEEDIPCEEMEILLRVEVLYNCKSMSNGRPITFEC